MAANTTHDQLEEEEEEDYIDISISSSSPTHSNEFEFQKNANLIEKFPTTSPADDLFCNGKLLPLHLPPLLQPSQKLYDSTTGTPKLVLFNSFHLPSTAGTTPFEPCSISPSTSCYASQELNPEDYFNKSQSNKSWSKKIKLLRRPSFSEKLRASTAYLKSLFAVSTCSNDTFAVPKAKDSSFVQRKPTRKSTFGLVRSFRGDKTEEGFEQRTSFSDTVSKFYSSSSSSSTSSSSSSSSMKPIGVNFVNSEVENLIQGAIAYCKKSHQSVCGKTTVGDDGLCSFSVSGVTDICEKRGSP